MVVAVATVTEAASHERRKRQGYNDCGIVAEGGSVSRADQSWYRYFKLSGTSK